MLLLGDLQNCIPVAGPSKHLAHPFPGQAKAQPLTAAPLSFTHLAALWRLHHYACHVFSQNLGKLDGDGRKALHSGGGLGGWGITPLMYTHMAAREERYAKEMQRTAAGNSAMLEGMVMGRAT
jgi:hypothetical protein